MQRRQFFVLDPNLSNVVGHYFEYDRAVAAGARDRGYHPVILANRQVNPEIAEAVEAHATFKRDIWGLAGPGSRAATGFRKLRDNVRFLSDLLLAIRRHGLPKQSVIFAHTFIDRQLLALAVLPMMLWWRRDVRYVFLLRYQPDFYRGSMARLAFRLLESLGSRFDLHLTTDSARLAEQFVSLTILRLAVLPIPHVPPDPPAAMPRRDRQRVRFVSLGNARDEKGIFEIINAIRLLRDRGQLDRLHFVIQCNDAAQDVQTAINEFAAEAPPHCELLHAKLESHDYYQQLWQADVVLLPYWRSIYFARTSGVFMEALSAGKPVIVTSDTWMGDELAQYGAGLWCHDHSPEQLADAIVRAAADLENLSAQSMAARPRWTERHNPDALIRAIEQLTASPPPPADPPRRASILYPHDDFIGRQSGSSRRVNLLADFLAARGMAVSVLQTGSSPPCISHGVTVESLGPEQRHPFARTFVGLAVLIASFGRGLKHRWMFWHYARIRINGPSRQRIRQMIRASDVVFVEYPFWASVVVPIAHQEGRKVVLTAHDVLADQLVGLPLLRRLEWHMELRAWRSADTLVAVSSADMATMQRHGFTSRYIPNPTDDRLFELERLGDARRILRDVFSIEPPGRRICLFIGSRFEPNLRAVAAIRQMAAHQATADIAFIVAGGCSPPALDGNFLALGRVDDSVIFTLYAACDIVLAPMTQGTGSSLKTIEGMATGKVVLGTSTGFRGLEIVAGEHAIVENDLSAYPQRIASILADAEAAKSIGASARAFAMAFGAERVYQEYLLAADLPLGNRNAPSVTGTRIEPLLVEIAQLALKRGHGAIARWLVGEDLQSDPTDTNDHILTAADDPGLVPQV